MDAVPIEGAVEIREAACTDANAARAALSRALARVNAPSRGADAPWRVHLTFSSSAHGTSADATIVDGRGEHVSARSVASAGRSCAGLSKAIGAWASLVADAELERDTEATPPPPPKREGRRATVHVALGADGFMPRAPEAPEPRAPAEAPAGRPIELGAAGTLMTGHGVGPLAGGSAFATVGVGGSWLLRATGTLATGVALVSPAPTTAPPSAARPTLFGARLDLCRRIPGNYIDRRGIQLDVCFGADGAALTASAPEADNGVAASDRGARTVGRFGAGPGVNLRGELGAGAAVELRGETALAIARSDLLGSGPAVATAAGLLGLSWRLP
jgi:hypothetical protein